LANFTDGIVSVLSCSYGGGFRRHLCLVGMAGNALIFTSFALVYFHDKIMGEFFVLLGGRRCSSSPIQF